MKKHYLLILLVLCLTIPAFEHAKAQDEVKFSEPDASPMDMAYVPRRGTKDIKVIYSRPSKKGRDVFGSLVPYDKVWRTGANEATEIHFAKDVTIGSETVEAGRYQLFTIPGEEEWTVVLNSEKDQWGAYQYKPGSDVAKVKTEVKRTDSTVEYFSIAFTEKDYGADMHLAWDDTYVTLPIKY